MDSDQPHRTAREVKFSPKAPSRRKNKTKKAEQPKAEGNDDSVKAQELPQHFNEQDPLQTQQQPNVEKKSSTQATFIHGPKQSAATRTPNVSQDRSHIESQGSELKHLDDNGEQPVIKEYVEPWDYNSYYPTTLPWRRPYSGDPEILNEAEFGEASKNLKFDEKVINTASELGLQDLDKASEMPRPFLMQFPPLPAIKRFASAKGKEKEGTSVVLDQRAPLASSAGGKGSSIRGASQQLCSLEDLSAGKMGKVLVHKSGAVKIKLGDVLYNVAPGTECITARNAVVISSKGKEFVDVGGLHKLAVVTPDIEDLLKKSD